MRTATSTTDGKSRCGRFPRSIPARKKGGEDCWMRGVGSSMLGVGRVRRGSGHRRRCVGPSWALVEDGDDLEWQADLEWLEGGCR
jgi:hypothetical protein